MLGYRPQLARSGAGFVTALVLPRGNATDSPHLVPMVKEQLTNTGVLPSMASADDGYSTQQGREEVLGLGVKVFSISGAKGNRKSGIVKQSRTMPTQQSAVFAVLRASPQHLHFTHSLGPDADRRHGFNPFVRNIFN